MSRYLELPRADQDYQGLAGAEQLCVNTQRPYGWGIARSLCRFAILSWLVMLGPQSICWLLDGLTAHGLGVQPASHGGKPVFGGDPQPQLEQHSRSTSGNAAPAASAGGMPPNIVLLVADDLGYGELFGDELSVDGERPEGPAPIATPHIDRLAAEGIRCTQAYVTASNCSPSRAGLFTGRIPTRFGYEFNPIGARNEDPDTGIPRSERMMAEMLHEAGYTTALIGKWHLGSAADYHPIRRGFDEFFGFTHEGHYFVPPPWRDAVTMLRRRSLPPTRPYPGEAPTRLLGDSAISDDRSSGLATRSTEKPSETRYQATSNLLYTSHMGHDEPAYDANNPILRAGQPVVEHEYLTDAFTREAVDFLERHQHSPFFLCVTYNAVHSPLQAKRETFDRLGHIDDVHRRIFGAMLADLDTSVGEIINTLDVLELSENTLVVLLSDNGGPTRELTSNNLPLRGGKSSMFEGGLRVPMILRWTDRLPADSVCEGIVSSLDLFPTFASLAQPEAELPSNLDGYDLLAWIDDEQPASPHRRLYWRQGRRTALREGAWKIVSENRSADERAWMLFNIDQDVAEQRNLADEEPERLRALLSTWRSLDAEMQDPRF
jgi:arylsulfatase A-like enzyme